MSDDTEATGPGRPSRGHSLRDFAGNMIRGIGAPTQRISLPGTSDRISQRQARAVIDLCLRVGEAMIATGAATGDVVATVLRISHSYGITSMHVDITFTSITISVHRGVDDDPLSVMRIVKVRTTDYTRLQDVYLLIDEITRGDGPRDIRAARRRLAAILDQPHPYRRWIVVFGKAVLTAGVVVMYNAGLVLALVAAASAIVAEIIMRRLGRLGIPAFFTQAAAAALMTGVAALLVWLNGLGLELPGSSEPTVIVISGIMLLLSGIGLTTAASDAISGYYLTAAARGLEVLMLTLGLAIGIAGALGVALRLGVPLAIAPGLGAAREFVPGVVGAALIGAGFALTSYVRLLIAPLMGLAAGLVFALYLAVLPVTSQAGLAPGIAGVFAGVLGHLIYRWLKVPEAAMAMAGIVGLIPGLAVYRALFAVMGPEESVATGVTALVSAVATGLGLAAGVTIGAFLVRRSFGLDRIAVMALRRTRRVR